MAEGIDYILILIAECDCCASKVSVVLPSENVEVDDLPPFTDHCRSSWSPLTKTQAKNEGLLCAEMNRRAREYLSRRERLGS